MTVVLLENILLFMQVVLHCWVHVRTQILVWFVCCSACLKYWFTLPVFWFCCTFKCLNQGLAILAFMHTAVMLFALLKKKVNIVLSGFWKISKILFQSEIFLFIYIITDFFKVSFFILLLFLFCCIICTFLALSGKKSSCGTASG